MNIHYRDIRQPSGTAGLGADGVMQLVAVSILSCGAVLAPLALGCSGPTARNSLEIAMGCASTCWAAGGGMAPWKLAAPVLASGLVFAQVIPLPDSLLGAIAPFSAGAWKVVLAGDGLGTISIDPAATAAGARRLLLGIATAIAVSDLARNRVYRLSLLIALSVSCCVMWSLGLIFPVDLKDRVLLNSFDMSGPIDYWRSPLLTPVQTDGVAQIETIQVANQRYQAEAGLVGDGFGSYVTSNQFAGGMCLTLPMALAVLLTATKRRMPLFLRTILVFTVSLLAVWTVGGVAQSRGGMASLLFTLLAFLLFVSPSGVWRWLMAIPFAGYAICLGVFTASLLGVISGVEKLFPADLQGKVLELVTDVRAVAAQAALRMFRASPVLGTGVDTYATMFSRFVPGDHVLYYAYNDYMQLLAETGALGIVVAITASVFVVVRARLTWRSLASLDPALAAAPLAGLAGISVHSMFEWNLHQPANGLLICIVIGMVASGEMNGIQSPRGRSAPRRGRMQFISMIVLVGACWVSVAWLCRDAATTRVEARVKRAIVADRLASNDEKKLSADFLLRSAVIAGERMATWDSGNAELAVLLGHANLHLAAHPEEAMERADHLRVAEQWFQLALRHAPLCRGLPIRTLKKP